VAQPRTPRDLPGIKGAAIRRLGLLAEAAACGLTLTMMVAPHAVADGFPARARELLHEAIQLGSVNPGVTTDIASAMAKLGDPDAADKLFGDAWRAALNQRDDVARRLLLTTIARAEAEAGQQGGAIKAARELSTPYDRALVLGQIAEGQAGAGKTAAALETTRLMPSQEVAQRDRTLVAVAEKLAERGAFADALSVVPLIHEAALKATALTVIGQTQADVSDLDGALQTAHAIPSESRRDVLLRRIACSAAQKGNVRAVEKVLRQIVGQAQRDIGTVCLVAALVSQNQLEKAADLVQQIPDPTQKAAAALELAIGYAARGDMSQTQALIRQAAARGAVKPDVIGAGMKRIVAALVRSGHFGLAEAFTEKLPDPAIASVAFETIGAVYCKATKRADAQRMFEEALQAAQSMPDPYQRSHQMLDVAMAQAKCGDARSATDTTTAAVAAARNIPPAGGTDVLGLIEIATSQARLGDPKKAEGIFELARAAATRYPEESYRADLLGEVAEAEARFGDIDTAVKTAGAQNPRIVRAMMLLGAAKGLLERQ
jgi:tetratricopeptide (TPR) repeat protein